MQKFKERLTMIELTEQQKAKILKNSMNPPSKIAKLPLIVAPVFVILASLFIFITDFNKGTPYTPTATTSASIIGVAEYELTKTTTKWLIVNIVLILSNLYLFKRNLNVMKRWERSLFIQELHVYVRKRLLRYLLVLLGGAFLWGITVSIPYGQLFNETIFILLLIGASIQMVLYHTKDNDWSRCPHCQVKFTRGQVQKKSFLEYREKCDACEQVIRVKKENYGDKIQLYTFTASFALGSNTLLELPLALTIFYVFGMVVLSYYLYFPYVLTFKKED